MAKIQTIGRLMLQDALPENLKDFDTVLDKKGIRELFTELATKNPKEYVDVHKRLNDIATVASTERGGEASIALKDLDLPPSIQLYRRRLQAHIQEIAQDPKLSSKKKNDEIVKYLRAKIDSIHTDVRKAAMGENNAFAKAIEHGFRGSPVQFTQLVFGDLLVSDHKGDPIPIPGLHGYGEGVTPMEYWAGSYGSRKGFSDVQFSTASTGYFGKRLALSANKIRVTGKDCGAENIGLQRDGGDSDNIGAVLAKDVAGFKAGTIITPKMLPKLEDKEVLLRSIATCQQPEGVCQLCSGEREDSKLPDIGDYIGVKAARVVSEPLTQLGLCLSVGTQVLMTSFKTKSIEDIVPGDSVFSIDGYGNKFPSVVKNKYENGLRDCYEYTLKKGRNEFTTVTCTPDHKFWTGMDWKSIKAIENNKLALAMPIGTFDDSYLTYNKFAMLLGLLLGDGCYTKSVKGVFFSCADPTLIEELADYTTGLNLNITKLVGHPYYYKVSCITEPTHPRDASGRFYAGGFVNPARVFLSDNDCLDKYAHEKTVPDIVYSWDNKAIAELLAGLIITDGSIFYTQNSIKINYASTSKIMVEQVKSLLLRRFGIVSGAVNVNSYGGRKRALYGLVIANFKSILKFNECIAPYLLGVKKRTWKTLFDKNLKAKASVNKQMIRPVRNYIYTVISKEFVGQLPTYDLEIDHPTHNFLLGNNLCSKNSSKHTGGALGSESKELSGFEEIEQFVDVPKQFVGKAILSPKDGKVTKIYKAPQGGSYMMVGGEQVYVPSSRALSVKVGDEVESGDVLTDGTPNPAEIAQYKGLGEGRKYFVDKFSEILSRNGVPAHKRNVEILARGFFDKVKITNPDGVAGYDIDEKVPYGDLQRNYEPRPGTERKAMNSSVSGQYLERPLLHYTIGTKLTPKVISRIKAAGIPDALVHKDHPGFEPEVVRLLDITGSDPDWKVRMAGFGLKGAFLDSATKGSTSKHDNPSFIPGLMDVSKL